jgi:hypothetical protein
LNDFNNCGMCGWRCQPGDRCIHKVCVTV